MIWVPVVLSWPAAVNAKSTAQAAFVLPLFYLSGIALINALARDDRRLTLARWLTALMLVWVMDSGIQYVLGHDLIGRPLLIPGQDRVTGFFHDLHQGAVMAVMLPVVFWVLDRYSRVAALAALAALGVVMVLSGSRTYLYFLILVMFGVIWHLRPSKRWVAGMLLVPVLVAGGSYMLSPTVTHERLTATVTSIQASQVSTFERLDRLLSKRMTLWETGWTMFKSNPLTGIGAKNFKLAYPQFATRADDPFVKAGTHPHQLYVEIIAETGLVGMLGMLLAIGLCLKWYLSAGLERREQAWPYALGLGIIFFPINSTPSLFSPWWFPIVMLLVCTMLAALDEASAAERG